MKALRIFRLKADLTETNVQLRRIADSLEMIVYYHCGGYRMSTPRADTSGPEPEALYSNDEESALTELREALKGIKPSDVLNEGN